MDAVPSRPILSNPGRVRALLGPGVMLLVALVPALRPPGALAIVAGWLFGRARRRPGVPRPAVRHRYVALYVGLACRAAA
jgi:hypothetical protein